MEILENKNYIKKDYKEGDEIYTIASINETHIIFTNLITVSIDVFRRDFMEYDPLVVNAKINENAQTNPNNQAPSYLDYLDDNNNATLPPMPSQMPTTKNPFNTNINTNDALIRAAQEMGLDVNELHKIHNPNSQNTSSIAFSGQQNPQEYQQAQTQLQAQTQPQEPVEYSIFRRVKRGNEIVLSIDLVVKLPDSTKISTLDEMFEIPFVDYLAEDVVKNQNVDIYNLIRNSIENYVYSPKKTRSKTKSKTKKKITAKPKINTTTKPKKTSTVNTDIVTKSKRGRKTIKENNGTE